MYKINTDESVYLEALPWETEVSCTYSCLMSVLGCPSFRDSYIMYAGWEKDKGATCMHQKEIQCAYNFWTRTRAFSHHRACIVGSIPPNTMGVTVTYNPARPWLGWRLGPGIISGEAHLASLWLCKTTNLAPLTLINNTSYTE